MKTACVTAALLALVLVIATDPAVAQPVPIASVWYRSSEQCPDGPSFLTRLEGRGLRAKLAEVGDRVDFVVTLGIDDHGPSGRLERQTQAGTVAIRELRADSCDEVADGLALSLALTFQPATPEPPVPVAEPDHAALEKHAPRPDQRGDTAQPRPVRDEQELSRILDERRAEWAVGAQAVVSTGIAPSAIPGGDVFLEHASTSRRVLSPSFRLAAFAGQSSSTTDRGDVRLRIGSLRLEGCPVLLRAATLELRPCAAADLGYVAADGTGPTGRSDAHTWLDLTAHARVTWVPARALAIEAQLGGLVPLTRYSIELANPSERVYRAAAVAFQGGIGAAVRW